MTSIFPTTASLERLLARFLQPGNHARERPVMVISREPSTQGTAHKEIVSCKTIAGQQFKVFCKYGKGRWDSRRGGVFYEHKIYDSLLKHLSISLPRLIGAAEVDEEYFGLFIEHIPQSLRISKVRGAMALGARWIGEFHRLSTDTLASHDMSFVQVFDETVSKATATKAARALAQLPDTAYAQKISERTPVLIRLLRSAPQTLIHGEYYPHNILVANDEIYPIDWETAAVGPGVLDLASLIEGWSDDVREKCISAYSEARWPSGEPAEFRQQLAAACLYWRLVWLPRSARDPASWQDYVKRIDSTIEAVEPTSACVTTD